MFELNDETDFIIMGNKGIFDKISTKEVMQCVYESTNEDVFSTNIVEQCGKVVDIIMKTAVMRKSQENLTCIFICFPNFKAKIYDQYERNSQQRKDYFLSCKQVVSTNDEICFYLKERGKKAKSFKENALFRMMKKKFESRLASKHSKPSDV